MSKLKNCIQQQSSCANYYSQTIKTHVTDELTTLIFWCIPSKVFTSRRQTLKWSSCNSSIHMFMASSGLLMLVWRTVANTFGTEGNLCKPRWKLLKLLFRLTRIFNIFIITCTKQLSLAHHGLIQLNDGLHVRNKNRLRCGRQHEYGKFKKTRGETRITLGKSSRKKEIGPHSRCNYDVWSLIKTQ